MASELLAIIARVKAARNLDNLDELSDAELVRQMAACFSDDAEERNAVADFLALTMKTDPQETVALFNELGVSISQDEIAELRRDPNFAEIKALLGRAASDDARQLASVMDAVRDYCGIGNATSGELEQCA